MKPAWAIDEYASIRLTSVWVTASRTPIDIVTAATTYKIGCHSSGAVIVIRSNAPNAATFVAEAMNAVIGAGAP